MIHYSRFIIQRFNFSLVNNLTSGHFNLFNLICFNSACFQRLEMGLRVTVDLVSLRHFGSIYFPLPHPPPSFDTEKKN